MHDQYYICDDHALDSLHKQTGKQIATFSKGARVDLYSNYRWPNLFYLSKIKETLHAINKFHHFNEQQSNERF